MPKQPLSADDMVDHVVTFAVPDQPKKTIKAAYVTTEDRHPDSYAFHDYEHRTVSLVRREYVLAVDRADGNGALVGG